MDAKQSTQNPGIVTKLLLLCVVSGFSTALAESKKVYLPAHDAYLGARAQGMGGAFVSVADDESAIFSNPAGIGQEDGKKTKRLLRGASFPNATAGFNHSPAGLQRALVKTDDDETRMERALKELNKSDLNYARTTLFPYFTVGRVQLGILVDQETQTYRTKYDTPQTSKFATSTDALTYDSRLDILSRSQVGGVLGFSVPHSKLGLSVGVSARATQRATIYSDFESSDNVAKQSAGDFKKVANKTKGLAIDSGILYRVSPKNWGPTLGLAVRDIGDTQYKGTSASNKIEVEKMNLVAGMSITPALGKYFGTAVTFEAQRINDNRVLVKDKLRGGLELRVGDNDVTAPMLLRAGHNGRGVSLGASLDLLLFKVDVAKYPELVDGPAGKRVDQRYLARLSIDLR